MINPSLNYVPQGEGTPLLVIHGLFGSSRNWQSLSKKFSEYFNVITIDLRNHGNSFHDPVMDYHTMAEDVAKLMDQLKIPAAHFLGHSMGGKLAMKLCSLYPERVKKLVVADIAPVRYQHDYDDIINPILSLDLSAIKNRKEVDEQLSSSITDQRIRIFLLQNLVFQEGNARWKLNWTALKENLANIVGYEDINDWLINNESLFIRGKQSNYVNDDSWALIQTHFLKAELITISDAGHWLHAEQPELFFKSVLEFLKS